jgi:uncharacterized membrane protein YuzA (DUF378 family)
MKKVIVSLSVLFAPAIAFAQPQVGNQVGTTQQLIDTLVSFFTAATFIIIAAAVVYVIWHAFQFVMAGGDEEKRKAGQNGIIYGVIGIAVMVSVWGLVTFLTSSFGVNNQVQTAPDVLPL